MSFWKDNTAASRQTPASAHKSNELATVEGSPKPALTPTVTGASVFRVEALAAPKESMIAADITVEGKIEGAGSVRIAGNFKGEVNVEGDVTIEAGARLTGGVRADKVTIAGELEGNVVQASHVNLLQTGVMIGDLKVGTLTVATGASMRGKVEFGWAEGDASKSARHGNGLSVESGTRS